MKTSLERVMTVFNWDSSNLRSRRLATSKVAIFSAPPKRRYAPLSFPPCPASTTTVLNVLLVFFVTALGAVAQAASKPESANAQMRRISRGIHIIYLKPISLPESFRPGRALLPHPHKKTACFLCDRNSWRYLILCL